MYSIQWGESTDCSLSVPAWLTTRGGWGSFASRSAIICSALLASGNGTSSISAFGLGPGGLSTSCGTALDHTKGGILLAVYLTTSTMFS